MSTDANNAYTKPSDMLHGISWTGMGISEKTMDILHKKIASESK